MNAGGSKHGIKRLDELTVPLMDKKMRGVIRVFHLPNHLAGLVRDPGIIRVARAPGPVYPLCLKLDKNNTSTICKNSVSTVKNQKPAIEPCSAASGVANSLMGYAVARAECRGD